MYSYTRLAVRGLSPRVRGNPPPHASALATPGSIPACAGEPRLLAPGCIPHRVYPRVCGGTFIVEGLAQFV